jgi:hypothetical protein
LTWRKRVLKAIKLFTAQAYKEPIWIITSLAFVYCGSVIVRYQSWLPNEQVRLANSHNEAEVQSEDYSRMLDLLHQIRPESKAAETLTKQFQSIVQDMVDSGQTIGHEEQIEDNYNSVVETRKRIELLIARLKGTAFRIPELTERTRVLEATLKTNISTLKIIEDYSSVYLTRDARAVYEQTRKTENQIQSNIIELETTNARLESEKMRSESENRSFELELERTISQREENRRKELLYYAALIFSIGYFLSIYRGVKNAFKETSRMVLRQKRVKSRPKKRRK